jgi:sterol desaturase/sphingolipid hydroxylase (fatty acid hydroxylase superfamily)
MNFANTLFPYGQAITVFGLASMLGSFIFLAIWEVLSPAGRTNGGRENRMRVNFGLGILNMTLSAILPLSSLAVAMLAEKNGWGVMQMVALDWYLAIPLLLLAKSLLGYGLHRSFHRYAWLWPLHAVHHRDDVIDLSTSFRSHPLAHVCLLVPNALLMLALGPDVWTALIVEAVLFFAFLFQHANIRLPDRISARLESWLVTPRMHLVHHARERRLHDSNYGEVFSIWDHLFGTYQRSPDGEFILGVEPARPAQINRQV